MIEKNMSILYMYILYIYIYIYDPWWESHLIIKSARPLRLRTGQCAQKVRAFFTLLLIHRRDIWQNVIRVQSNCMKKKCIQLCLWKTFFLFSQPKVKPRNRKSSQTNQPWNQLALPRNQALCLLAVGIRDVSSSVLRQLNEAEGERQVSGIHVECS